MPAILAREILVRLQVLAKKSWLPIIVVAFCLAFSAFYELTEWWISVLTEDGADAFLGTQGYIWDTQSDMLLALVGAGVALLSLSRAHDRQLERFKN